MFFERRPKNPTKAQQAEADAVGWKKKLDQSSERSKLYHRLSQEQIALLKDCRLTYESGAGFYALRGKVGKHRIDLFISLSGRDKLSGTIDGDAVSSSLVKQLGDKYKAIAELLTQDEEFSDWLKSREGKAEIAAAELLQN